jgi:hypothetical protein
MGDARALVMATAVLLCGCSGTGLLPAAGPNAYTIKEGTTVFLGSSDVAEKDALNKAKDFCRHKGLSFVPNNLAQTTPGPGNIPSYSATFKCLPANDPRVAN